jgi:hypothetical protein
MVARLPFAFQVVAIKIDSCTIFGFEALANGQELVIQLNVGKRGELFVFCWRECGYNLLLVTSCTDALKSIGKK